PTRQHRGSAGGTHPLRQRNSDRGVRFESRVSTPALGGCAKSNLERGSRHGQRHSPDARDETHNPASLGHAEISTIAIWSCGEKSYEPLCTPGYWARQARSTTSL